MCTNVVVDTSILIKKSLGIFEYLNSKGYNPLFPTVVLYEYMNFVRKRWNELRNKKNIKSASGRAIGHIETADTLFNLIKDRISKNTTTLLNPDIDDFIKSLQILKDADVDAGDAIITTIAAKLQYKVITGDRDWERLKDYVDYEIH
ncbi:PIN domain-containing protein [Sulfolobus tengchongensis]|uniref:PIN domain-containing protein n=1 Tax=Sulfolobus tengchongensis TaxID=207809 RepID=A0AAX4KXZ1_9CREN